jgi:hypothetical protein
MLKLTSNLVVAFGLLTAASRAQTPDAPGVDVYDGFETPRLSTVWETSRFERGALEMQTNTVRSGSGAAKITLRARDKFESGTNGKKDSERAELLETSKFTAQENIPYEYSFSLFIPTDFPIVPTRLVIAQWKQFCPHGGHCDDDSPVLALRYESGRLRWSQQIAAEKKTLFQTEEDLRGKWTDFRFQLRFTTNRTGFIKAWINGKQVVDHAGVSAYPENAATSYPHPSSFYFKMGLYRDVMAEPMTLYIDEYRKRQLPDEKR